MPDAGGNYSTRISQPNQPSRLHFDACDAQRLIRNRLHRVASRCVSVRCSMCLVNELLVWLVGSLRATSRATPVQDSTMASKGRDDRYYPVCTAFAQGPSRAMRHCRDGVTGSVSPDGVTNVYIVHHITPALVHRDAFNAQNPTEDAKRWIY